MFDVPQILSNGKGNPLINGHPTIMTLIMWLNQNLYSRNYGLGGALSVILFIITGILSLLVFHFTGKNEK